LIYNLKLKLFISITLVDFAELLTDFSYTNFTVCIGQTPCSLEHYLVGNTLLSGIICWLQCY